MKAGEEYSLAHFTKLHYGDDDSLIENLTNQGVTDQFSDGNS